MTTARPFRSIRSFEEFLSPLGVDEFFCEYLGQRPFHIAGERERFSHLLTLDSLNRLLSYRCSDSTFRLFRELKEIPKEKYLKKQKSWLSQVSLLDLGALNVELSQGATIVINKLEQLHEPVSSMCRVLEQALSSYVDVVSFAAWRPSHAFSTHWDHEDVFIVQVAGRKHWRLFPHERRHPTVKDRTTEFTPPTEQPYWEGDLESGDLLYIPSGWWHDAVAKEGPTIHLSFGCEFPTGLDLAQEVVNRLSEFESMRAILPRHASESQRQHYMQVFRQMIQETTERVVLDTFLRERDTMAPATGRLSLPWSAAPSSALPWSPHTAPASETAPLPGSAWLHWLPPRSVSPQHSAGQISLDMMGYRFTFDSVATPVLTDLMTCRKTQIDALQARHAEEFLERLLVQLISWGIIAITQEEDG